MGTNFYWAGDGMSDDVHVHIGKRSRAGPYCWSCGSTLCSEGSDRVHAGGAHWYEKCPGCGGTEDPGTPGDIRRCTSFTWTLMAHKETLKHLRDIGDESRCVEDEYGATYTAREFLDVELREAMIEMQYGGRFS